MNPRPGLSTPWGYPFPLMAQLPAARFASSSIIVSAIRFSRFIIWPKARWVSRSSIYSNLISPVVRLTVAQIGTGCFIPASVIGQPSLHNFFK